RGKQKPFDGFDADPHSAVGGHRNRSRLGCRGSSARTMRWHWALWGCLLGCDSETLLLGRAPPATDARVVLTSIDAQAPEVPDAAPSPPAPDATPPPVQAPAFSEPALVAELVADTENLNPTLTHDLQLLLFNSNGDADASVGGKDLFLAERVDGRSDFAEPSLLALSTE